MKKIVFLSVFCLISFSFLPLSSGETPGEGLFISTNNLLPEKLPKMLTKQGVTKALTWKITLPIEIPGLPSNNRTFFYVEYSGKLPKNWSGTTLLGHPEKGGYWPVLAYIAVKKDSGMDVVFCEIYHVGFLSSLFATGVDLAKIEDAGVTISFKNKSWSFDQLDDAISRVGMIRGARASGKPEAIKQRFDEILKLSGTEYALSKRLIKLSKNDPDKYLELIEEVIKIFLEKAPKKGTEPKKIEFDNKTRLLTLR
jgi:hypothetical protein